MVLLILEGYRRCLNPTCPCFLSSSLCICLSHWFLFCGGHFPERVVTHHLPFMFMRPEMASEQLGLAGWNFLRVARFSGGVVLARGRSPNLQTFFLWI